MHILVVDALTLGEGRRGLTRDFIGAGPRMVAATLRSCKIEASICRGEDFLRSSKAMAMQFDACLVSGMTMDKPSVVAISRAWKAAAPNKPVIVGGPVSLEPASLLRQPTIDAVVPGEAERVLNDACKDGSLPDFAKNVPTGFLTRSTVNHVDNPGKDILANRWPTTAWIEQHVPPSIDLLASYPNAWASRVYIELLRGCSNHARARLDQIGDHACKDCGYCDVQGEFQVDIPNPCVAGIKPGCGFCSTPAVSGPIRSFSIPYIEAQVKDCIDLGCHRVVLGGSDVLEFQREKLFKPGRTRPVMPPPPNHDALNELVNRLLGFEPIKRGDVQVLAENIKASLCDDESLAILGQIPGIAVSIGVETGSDEHLAQIGKSTTIATIKHAVQLLNNNDIRYHAYFIHSLPGQTPQTVAESVRLMGWLETNAAEKITIYRFKPLPGTAFEGFRVSGSMLDEAEPMVREARRINEARKEAYVGQVVKVLVAEQDFRDKTSAIAYMLQGGPKIKLPGCRQFVNDKKVHVARITSVISDKMTEGTLVE